MRKYISISASFPARNSHRRRWAYVALFVIKRHKRLGDRKVEAILPSADLCEKLQIAANKPLLSVARQTFQAGKDSPFEYCRYYVLSEYFGEIHYH